MGLNDAPLCSFLVNGFPTWDMFVLGVSQHGTPITHSALVPMAVCFLAIGLRFLRPLASGFAAGVAGHLVFVALHDTLVMNWLPGGMQELWLFANALFCVVLATAAAAKK